MSVELYAVNLPLISHLFESVEEGTYSIDIQTFCFALSLQILLSLYSSSILEKVKGVTFLFHRNNQHARLQSEALSVDIFA